MLEGGKMYATVLVTRHGRWKMGFIGDTLSEVKHNIMLHQKGPLLVVGTDVYEFYFIIKLNNAKLKSGIKNIFISDEDDEDNLLINKKIVYAQPLESMKGMTLKEALDEVKMFVI